MNKKWLKITLYIALMVTGGVFIFAHDTEDIDVVENKKTANSRITSEQVSAIRTCVHDTKKTEKECRKKVMAKTPAIPTPIMEGSKPSPSTPARYTTSECPGKPKTIDLHPNGTRWEINNGGKCGVLARTIAGRVTYVSADGSDSSTIGTAGGITDPNAVWVKASGDEPAVLAYTLCTVVGDVRRGIDCKPL